MEHLDLLNIVHNEFINKKNINPRFSTRAYAKYLGIDASDLSKIMRGKKDFNETQYKKITKRLITSESQQSILLGIYNAREHLRNSNLSKFENVIVQKKLTFAFEVIHDVLLELVSFENFKHDIDWISEVTGFRRDKIEKALNELREVELLVETEGKLRVNDEPYTTNNIGENATSESAVEYQRTLLKLSSQALELLPIQKRDHSSYIVATSKNRLADAKIMIKEFRRKLGSYLEGIEPSERDTIYAVQVGFFPIEETLNDRQ